MVCYRMAAAVARILGHKKARIHGLIHTKNISCWRCRRIESSGQRGFWRFGCLVVTG
jgi:hypothetical protein